MPHENGLDHTVLESIAEQMTRGGVRSWWMGVPFT
jgi:hypothetical protein